MEKRDVKIGMKVVPFQKTVYSQGLDASAVWKRAKKDSQPYVYVVGWEDDVHAWILHEKKDSATGDFFNSCDFKPYEEQVKVELNKKEKEEVEVKLIYDNGNEEYKIGLKTPLVDIDNNSLYTGDVVAFKDGDNSIVCTERGDIMGIWGGSVDDIKEYGIRKIKSYKELKDGEVYSSCVKVKIEKKESKTVKESKLQKELRKVEARAEELRVEIQKQEHEKTICEDIGMYSVDRTENMKGEQYISRDKLKLKLHDSKSSEYTVTYRREGYKTICEFSSRDIVGEGVAKCNPDDEFDYFTGLRIAELRARSDFYKKIADKVAREV